jgi:hypothetical protein
MVSVIKQRQQYQNQQIGINRADMSVANDLGRVADLADKVSNRMFQEAADNAAKASKKFLDELPNNSIYGVDPKTGRPKVIDLQESLPSKGYGTYAQDLIKKGLDERFITLATNEYKEKSAEFAAKYPFSPTKYKQEMSRFVSEMKKPYGGKYATIIENGATEWIGRTQAVILEQALKNQRRIAGMDLANALNNFSLDIGSIGIQGETLEKGMAIIDQFVDSKENVITSARNLGTFKQNPKQLKQALKAEFAINKLKHVFESVTRLDKDGVNGAIFIDNIKGGRFDFPEEFSDRKAEIKKLYSYVQKGGRLGELGSQLVNLQEDNNRVLRAEQARKIAEEKTDQSEELASIALLTEEMLDDYDPTLENNSFAKFTSTLQQTSNISSATNLLLSEVKKIQDATTPQKITGLVSTRSILDSTQAKQITNQLTEEYRNHIGDTIIATFGRDKVKLNALEEFINSPSLDGKLNMKMFRDNNISLSNSERGLLEQFRKYASVSDDPRNKSYENWGGSNQVRLTTALRSEIASEVSQRTSLIHDKTPTKASIQIDAEYAEGRLDKFPETNKKMRERHEAEFLMNPVYGKAIMQVGGMLKALQDPRFMSPQGEYYQFYQDMTGAFVQNNIIPEALGNFMKGMKNGTYSAAEGKYVLDFIQANISRPMDTRNIIKDNQDNSFSINVERINLFKRGHGLDEEAAFFAEFVRSTQAFPTDLKIKIFQNSVRLLNDSSEKENLLNDLRSKFNLSQKDDPIAYARKELAKIAGGRNNPLFNMLKDSVDEWGALNFNKKDAKFSDWVENIKETSFGGSDDIVLDMNGAITISNPADIKTPYSPKRLFGEEKAKLFAQWADTLIREQTDGTYSLISGDRGSMPQSQGFFSNLFAFSKPMTAGDKTKKVWLVPDPYTTTTVFSEPKLNTMIFRPHFVNKHGEIEPALFKRTKKDGKEELVYPEIMVSDFIEFSKFQGMRR